MMLWWSLRCRVGKHQYLWRAAPLRNYALPSPRTLKTKSPERKNLNPAPKFPDVPRWPTNVFTNAYQNGAMKVSPVHVNHFLNDIWDLANSRQLNRTNVDEKLKERGLEVEDLTMIAKLLMTQRPDMRLTSLGLDCLSLAADLGDLSAAVILVDVAIENKAHMGIGTARYQKALAHIKTLAATKDVQSMVLLGRAYEQSHNSRAAFNVYQEVIEMNNARLQANESVPDDARVSLAEAYRNMGRLTLHSSGSENSAFQSFETAALKYEDPISFYYMALMRKSSHKDYITLLLQAATSGVTDAAYELGLSFAKEGDTLGRLEKGSRPAYLMAVHWFELAQDVPKLSGRARLHIARIRQTQKASGTPGIEEIQHVSKELSASMGIQMQQFIRSHWDNPSFSLTAVELERKMEEIKD